MKSRIKFPVLLGVLGTLALTGCAKTDAPAPQREISVGVADSYQIVLKDTEISGYDFSSLFKVTVDGAVVTVDSAWVDASAVKTEAGEYEVVCSYGNQVVTVKVTVVATVHKLVFTAAANGGAITLLRSQVSGYDFNALFKATEDGKAVEITADMVETDVAEKAGEYTYKVTYAGYSLTLAVSVRDDILVVPAYRTAEVPVTELDGFDFTSLFSLYIEGKAVRVTESMVDATAAENAEQGDTFDVAFSYEYKGTPYNATVAVKVVGAAQYTVSVKNAETYPHAENIDLTTLFEIKKDGKPVPVTSDMITGEVDYNIEDGESEKVSVITLTFNGKEYKANVTVKSGVVIAYKRGATIVVSKGTDKAKYPFAGDFAVTVDGIGFLAIPEAYLVGLDELDFNTVGEYEVTLKIPYSNTRPSISGGVAFKYTEKTVKYVVSEYDSTVSVYKEHVTLKNDTASYNPFSNIGVVVNGKLMNLTDNREWVSAITCYAEVKSDDIDFSDAGTQTVVVDVYANGLNATPVTVTFYVTIESGITVTAKDIGVFAGATLYTKDLFVIERNGAPVEVTYDMISGKADTFKPGVYEITANYEGVTATATVTVFQTGMQGTYRTKLTTIPVTDADDDDDDGDYGWGGSGDDWYGDGEYSLYAGASGATRATSTTGATTLGDMIIGEDGSIVVNGYKASIVGGVDESTLLLDIGTNRYTMYYDNGIIVLDPDNSLKLGFTDYRRPMVYFNADAWSVESKVEINYSDSHVLSNSFTGYTIDTFKLKSTTSDEIMWYGLKVQLVEKHSADTLYRVSWGEAEFADGFSQKEGAVSSVRFLGDEYGFTMKSATVAKVNKANANTTLGGTYRGSYDGEDARLIVSDTGGFEFTVGGKKYASYILNDFVNYKNSYIDNANKTIFGYRFKDDGSNPAFSYKFEVDPDNGTFTVVERDSYYGRYEADGMFIYLDGYGTGAVNFDTSMFASTQIKYTVNSGVVSIRFVNISQSFTHGERADFYMGEFLNTLTVKHSDSAAFAGKRFVNALVTDGAVISVETSVIGKTTTTLGTKELLQSIHIVTKDGELDEAAKAAAINLAYVSFDKPGFYNYSIALSVNGKSVTANYAVQIVDTVVGDDTVYTALGSGVMNGNVALNLNAHGLATIIATGVRYEGTASAMVDGKFVVKAYSADGGVVIADCEKVADGILKVTTTGAISLTDYFTTGANRVCGVDGYVIREFTVGTQKTYIVSKAATLAGETAEVVFESGSGDAGSVLKLTTSEGEKRVRIVAWGKVSDGLIVLD